jgi:hypothetical protein
MLVAYKINEIHRDTKINKPVAVYRYFQNVLPLKNFAPTFDLAES